MLGIEAAADAVTKFILRNITVLTEKPKVLSTYANNQPRVLILSFEGDRFKIRDSNLLSKFKPHSVLQVEVIFYKYANCILDIFTFEKGNGKT